MQAEICYRLCNLCFETGPGIPKACIRHPHPRTVFLTPCPPISKCFSARKVLWCQLTSKEPMVSLDCINSGICHLAICLAVRPYLRVVAPEMAFMSR